MNRAERRRRTANVVRQRLEFVVLIYEGWGNPDYPKREAHIKAAIGRSKKMHPMDCGKTKCGVCGGDQRWMCGPTRKELLSEFDFEEQVREFEDV